MYIVYEMRQNLQNNNHPHPPPLSKLTCPTACSGDSGKNGEMTQNSKSIYLSAHCGQVAHIFVS